MICLGRRYPTKSAYTRNLGGKHVMLSWGRNWIGYAGKLHISLYMWSKAWHLR